MGVRLYPIFKSEVCVYKVQLLDSGREYKHLANEPELTAQLLGFSPFKAKLVRFFDLLDDVRVRRFIDHAILYPLFRVPFLHIYPDFGYQVYEMRKKISGVDEIHNFLLFGWGKFHHVLPKEEESVYLGEAIGAEADLLLIANGIQLTPEQKALLEGVSWS